MISTNFAPHIEISLDNLIHNIKQIRSIIPPQTDIIAVVKDNAYGCGSIPIAKAMEQYGNIHFFAVARAEEAFTLRENGVKGTILVLGRVTAEQVEKGSLLDIVFTLNDFSDFEIWEKCKYQIRFHCNIDTAMHRLGLLPPDMPELIKRIKASEKKYKLEGVFTHLARADEPDTPTIKTQHDAFFKSIEVLRKNNINPTYIHYGNSAGLMCSTIEGANFVRPGVALYGYKPDPKQEFCLKLRQIVSFKSSVVKIKKVPAQTPVSYGGNYVTSQPTFIATIAMGYGQGLPRYLNGKGSVLINGKRYKIAGNITMDYIMVDVGPNSQVKVGDEVVAIGSQGNEEITADEIAVFGNTIGYEVICNLGRSIDHFYVLNDSIVFHKEGWIY